MVLEKKSDPGEKKDVAAEHPDVVREMDAAYDKWWDEVLPLLEEFMTSRGPSERAACLVAVTRIRHARPALPGRNGNGEAKR